MKDLDGKSYRLLQNNLDKDIVPEESKILVKKDKVLIKLQKVRGMPPMVLESREAYATAARAHTEETSFSCFVYT